MIPTTKPYLPNREKLFRYIDGIYERSRLTNHGPLVEELTHRLEDYLKVDNLLLVANGTLALQITYRVLKVNDSEQRPRAITSPFSFVATASSLKWEGIDPIFSDIESRGWCLDPQHVETELNQRIRALVPVHVFGNACDVEAFEHIAECHGLKLIFDGAHAFGVKYRGTSLLQYGDATTLSFHATKLFHTIEGGAIIFRRKEHLEIARRMINFGFSRSGSVNGLGINAKMSEFQAAMGLCVLDEIDHIMERRADIWNKYHFKLKEILKLQEINKECKINHSYFPVIFESESTLLNVKSALEHEGIYAKRYFYPSLDSLGYTDCGDANINSKNISERVLCLPLYPDMIIKDAQKVIEIITGVIR